MMLLRNILMATAASKMIAQRKIVERLRGVGIGIGLFVMSGVFLLLGLIGGIFSIFFALAHVQGFVYASLVAGGVSLLLALLLWIQGKKFFRGF